MQTLLFTQSADISSPSPFHSFPFSKSVIESRGFGLVMFKELQSRSLPVTSKAIVARLPEPLTPVEPAILNTTLMIPMPWIVSQRTLTQLFIVTSLPPMSPPATSVTFRTFGSNRSQNCPESSSSTSLISILTSNVSLGT